MQIQHGTRLVLEYEGPGTALSEPDEVCNFFFLVDSDGVTVNASLSMVIAFLPMIEHIG